MNNKITSRSLSLMELKGFKEMTSVQKICLDFSISNKDVVLIAKTGTGKTHAYLFPIIERINTKSNKTQVLISLPTRELAYQVYEEVLLMKKILPDIRIVMLRGGDDRKRLIQKLENTPHIIIGTPGRIKDLFTDNTIRVDYIQTYIIDEADMTLEYGFLEDIDIVLSHMIKNPQIMCFSATFPENLKHFVNKYLNKPKIIDVVDKKRAPKIEHILIACKHKSYEDTLLSMLDNINPYLCLIFTNTKEEADSLYQRFNDKGIKSILLHGGLEQRVRNRALKDLKSKKYIYAICSDLASRGLDIEGISHVISLGFPKDLSFYIHRSGRTGRNKNDGICYALYKPEDINAIKSLKERGINFKAMQLKNDGFKEIKNPLDKRKKPFDLTEKEIAKTLKRKKEKVKPNYKKKKNQEIERIKRKKRREFIKEKIKEEKKERYRKKNI